MTTTAIPAGWDCARFEGALADLLEGELPAAERAAAEAHAAACAACGPLVADLRAITAEAATLPPVPPARDLWAGIEARLETPVVRLADRAAERAAPTRRAAFSFSARRLAAAAAALVAVTSAGTWWLARGSGGAAPTVAATPAAPSTVAPATVAQAPVGTSAPAADAPEAVAGTSAADAARDAAPASAGGAADARFVRAGASRTAPNVAALGAPGAAYDREIAELRATVRERRGELDPATVAVLERNLAIIDAAIADSRTALAREPRSAIVGDQLQRALSRKVELLRTLATLPRT